MDDLGRISADEIQDTAKNPFIIILDDVRSMHNVGSTFRTGDAFAVEAIYLCGYTPTPPHRDIHKTALGAENTVVWEYFSTTEEAVEILRNEGYTIIAIEQVEGSISLNDYRPEPNEKLALIFGNEVRGVQQEVVTLCDKTIEIPQFGTKHSFNISVSAGIVLWDLFNKLKRTGS